MNMNSQQLLRHLYVNNYFDDDPNVLQLVKDALRRDCSPSFVSDYSNPVMLRSLKIGDNFRILPTGGMIYVKDRTSKMRGNMIVYKTRSVR